MNPHSPSPWQFQSRYYWDSTVFLPSSLRHVWSELEKIRRLSLRSPHTTLWNTLLQTYISPEKFQEILGVIHPVSHYGPWGGWSFFFWTVTSLLLSLFLSCHKFKCLLLLSTFLPLRSSKFPLIFLSYCLAMNLHLCLKNANASKIIPLFLEQGAQAISSWK